MDYKEKAEAVWKEVFRVRGLIEGGYELPNNVQGPSEILAAFGRQCAAEAVRDERSWADALWYDAMKWGGIGGIMRAKLNMRVVNTRSKILAAVLDKSEVGERP